MCSSLENSLDYEDCWCMDYAREVLGFVLTDCQCEAGYDGTQEMKCPMGSSDGEDATCSGTNGFCIPKDSSDIFEDRSDKNLQENMIQVVLQLSTLAIRPIYCSGYL